MATDLQLNRFYRPAWSRCFKALWQWEGERGSRRLVARPGRTEAPELPRVETLARQMAQAEARGWQETDLRHACHRLALGRDCSSAVMTNDQLDLVEALFRVLTDPLDLEARMDLDNPSRMARRRYVHGMREFFEDAYVRSECDRIYHTREWTTLSDNQLRDLYRHLHNRRHARKSWTRPKYQQRKGTA